MNHCAQLEKPMLTGVVTMAFKSLNTCKCSISYEFTSRKPYNLLPLKIFMESCKDSLQCEHNWGEPEQAPLSRENSTVVHARQTMAKLCKDNMVSKIILGQDNMVSDSKMLVSM